MIVRLSGGLGNQMFQYAFGRAFSLEKGEKLLFDDFSFSRDPLRKFALFGYTIETKKIGIWTKLFYNFLYYLNRKYLFIKRGNTRCGIFYERQFFVYENLRECNARYYDGCWQNVNYFEQVKEIIKKELTYQGGLSESAKEWLEKIKSCEAVVVHVRHGDYLNENNRNIYEVPKKSYYDKAINYIRRRFPESFFFFFSDDMDWCKKNFGEEKNCFFIDKSSVDLEQENIFLMQNCKHFIIANSSFSWWGAWLGMKDDSVCIAPEKWFVDKNMNEEAKKALLKNFIMIDNG